MKPHDELFREMVTDPGAQKDLVRIALPDLVSRIELSSVAPVDATFTGGKQADLLLSVRERGGSSGRRHLVYVLVEHKSYADPIVAVQLLRYVGAIWQQQWVQRPVAERGSLPVIHPVVVYHGRESWTAPLRLSGLHGEVEIPVGPRPPVGAALFFPAELEYRLVDLKTLEPPQLQIRARTLAFLITLKYVLRPLNYDSTRRLVSVLTETPIDTATRLRLFEYLLWNTLEENTTLLLEITEETGYNFEGGETVMTMAQELIRRGRVEGREEGREEGLEEGRAKGREEVALRMLEKGLSIELIVETTGLTHKDVEKLQKPE